MTRILSCVLAAALSLAAQSAAALNGPFVLAEETATTTTLSMLQLDGKGNLTGTQYFQGGGTAQAVPVSGSYSVAADGSGSLFLQTPQPADSESAAPAVVANYQFLQSKASGFALLRSDGGTSTVAHLAPGAAAKAISGSYAMEADGNGTAEIAILQFAASGTFAGKAVAKTASGVESVNVTGMHVQETDGFWALRLFRPGGTDEDGQSVTWMNSYVAAARADGRIVAIRVASGQPGLVLFDPLR